MAFVDNSKKCAGHLNYKTTWINIEYEYAKHLGSMNKCYILPQNTL